MRSFSFIHAADLHLGYAQYNLEARREDFDKAFQELVNKSLELKPNFLIIAGDIFQQARPLNSTLESVIQNLRKLRDADVSVLAVDGSHDAAPNVITGTILNPLDSAGLIYYLPRHEGACWGNENCYVYGIPNFRTKRRTEELLPEFLKQNPPTPDPKLFNILVFHMALDMPDFKPPQMEAEATPEMLPDGFNYYAGGHVHQPVHMKFKNGILAYSGCTETVNYEDAGVNKGFFHVEVNDKGELSLQRIKLDSPRHFKIFNQKDYTGVMPKKITEELVQLVKDEDEEGVIIVPVIKGILPAEANRNEVDLSRIRGAAEKALLVHPIMRLKTSEVPEEVIHSIFEGELKDLKTKAFEYFLQIFAERYPRDEAERIARLSIALIEPLTHKEEEKAKQLLEGQL
ncbi:MAG TPA: DNA repair exonuclease [Candidatus Krumholzibacteriaceae bacterium]|nr:DNA repair exonuclease [Candidatus Krumholzibacteriaceae bacterium]